MPYVNPMRLLLPLLPNPRQQQQNPPPPSVQLLIAVPVLVSTIHVFQHKRHVMFVSMVMWDVLEHVYFKAYFVEGHTSVKDALKMVMPAVVIVRDVAVKRQLILGVDLERFVANHVYRG